jgi:hypothetical protein
MDIETPPLSFWVPSLWGGGVFCSIGGFDMRKFLATVLAVFAGAYANVAYAACSSHTYIVNGKMITCTTCCYYGNCTTNCF